MEQNLLNVLRGNPEFEKALPCWVSIYLIERCYGGPEEGGWWWTRCELEGGIPFVTEADANAYLATQRAEIAARNKDQQTVHARAFECLPDEDEVCCPQDAGEGYIPTGWGDGGDYEIVVEFKLGAMDNSQQGRPHYE